VSCRTPSAMSSKFVASEGPGEDPQVPMTLIGRWGWSSLIAKDNETAHLGGVDGVIGGGGGGK